MTNETGTNDSAMNEAGTTETTESGTTETKRPSILVSLILLVVAIAVGAHVSAIPLLLFKAGVATVLVFVYGYFAVRIIGAMQIGAAGARVFIGLLLGAATLYMTWAIRIPAFSGWDVPFTLNPQLIYDAILQRSGSMQVSRGFGHGTSAEGPSWLMLGTYIAEAVFFLAGMVLGALLSDPTTPSSNDATAENAGNDSEDPDRQAA